MKQGVIVILLLVIFLLISIGISSSISEVKDRGQGLYGIDVSHHQGKINWKKVKTWKNHELAFVYIKATEGASWLDPKFAYNFKQAKKNGLKTGSYHYFKCTSSPEEQFKHFTKYAKKEEQDLIPMIDLETLDKCSCEDYNIKLHKFLTLVTEYYGRKPILYSLQGFYNTNLKNRYLDYYWVMARYNRRKPYLLDKNRWTIWQFSDKAKVYGINKNVDINYYSPQFRITDIYLK